MGSHALGTVPASRCSPGELSSAVATTTGVAARTVRPALRLLILNGSDGARAQRERLVSSPVATAVVAHELSSYGALGAILQRSGCHASGPSTLF